MAIQKINIAGQEYHFDGRGYAPAPPAPFQETDPKFEAEKGNLVRKHELPPLSEIATKDDIPVVTNLALKPQYSDIYYRKDAAYNNDYIWLKSIGTNKIYDVKKLTVRTSFGDKVVDSKVVFNNGYCFLFSEYLSKSANWELFIIEYDLVDNIRTYPPDLRGKIGRDVLINEPSARFHGTAMKAIFESAYLLHGGTKRKAITVDSNISTSNLDEEAVKKKFNIAGFAYMGGSQNMEVSSTPDILICASYYSNSPTRFDITPDANTFLKNTIAISAGQRKDGTGEWTSHGFGVEFCEVSEDLHVLYNDEKYKLHYTALFSFTIGADKRTITVVSPHKVDNPTAPSANRRYVGETLWIHNGAEKIEFKVAQIIDDTAIVADRDINVSGTFYVWGYMSYLASISPNSSFQQSPAQYVAIGKFAVIQDRTNANWQLIREAARMTASNSTMQVVGGKKVYTTHWDMKRGFGIIDVNKAVEYIEDNYINNQEYIDSVIPQLPKINPLLKMRDLDSENYVSKGMIDAIMKTVWGSRNLASIKYMVDNFTFINNYDYSTGWMQINHHEAHLQTIQENKDAFGLTYEQNTQYTIISYAETLENYGAAGLVGAVNYTDGSSDYIFSAENNPDSKQIFVTDNGKTVKRIIISYSNGRLSRLKIAVKKGTIDNEYTPAPEDLGLI